MEPADRILELLYDRGGFVWMDELAAVAGTERAALQRALAALRGRGHTLEVSPASGVRLVRPVRPDAHLVARRLGEGHFARRVVCLQEVTSTNDVAFDLARGGAEGLAVTAECQRAGRGRMGRRWVSAPGCGVLASALLPASDGRLAHGAVTIAAGLAVAQGVEDAAGVSAALVWPNDLVRHGAKLGGVLVEVRRVGDARRLVVGFGINVAEAPPAEDVGRPVTCLAEAADRPGALERNEILAGVLRRLDDWIVALRAGRTDDLHRQWLRRCGMINARVCVERRTEAATQRLSGRVLDVDPLTGLVLLTDEGQTLHLPAAGCTLL